MLFNSVTFLIFFGIVLALHNLPISWTWRKANLLVASYIFYAAWNPPFVVLLWITNLIDWYAAWALDRTEAPKARRGLIVISMAANLGLLGFFKYGNFMLENFIEMARMIGIEYHPAPWSIILPIGISFYTFHSMSYTIDVYRRKYKPCDSFLDFALYVGFWPALVAGPILRADPFLEQCRSPRTASAKQYGWGLSLLVLGLFSKTILADWIMGPVSDDVFSNVAGMSCLDAWVGVLAFSGQIYFDFSGYSLCAVGTAMCLGFMIPDNFHFPYASIGFSDFWRRWHISLSSWLRDYLYITLGGNRSGHGRTHLNLMLTMLLGGLWHGASWKFVVWGGLHGVYLVMERLFRGRWGETWMTETRKRQVGFALLTYFLVLITWVFFRAANLSDSLAVLGAMFLGSGNPIFLPDNQIQRVLLLTVGLLAAHWLLRDSNLEAVAARLKGWQVSVVLAGLLLTMILNASGDSRGFIYFQF